MKKGGQQLDPIRIDKAAEFSVELHWSADAVCNLDLICFCYSMDGTLVNVIDGVNQQEDGTMSIMHSGDSQKMSESISILLERIQGVAFLCFGVCAQFPAVSLFDSCRVITINANSGDDVVLGNISCPSYPLRHPLGFLACFLQLDTDTNAWMLHHERQVACADRGFTKLLPLCRKLMCLPDGFDDLSNIAAIDKAAHMLLAQSVETLQYDTKWAGGGECSLSAFCLGSAGETLGVVSHLRNADTAFNSMNKATSGIDSPQVSRKVASLVLNIADLDESISEVVVALECSSAKAKKIVVTLKRDGEVIGVLKPHYAPFLVLNKLVRLGARYQMVSVMEAPRDDLSDTVMLFRGKPKRRTLTIRSLRGVSSSCKIRVSSQDLPYLAEETQVLKKITTDGAMHHFDYSFVISSFFGRQVTITFDVIVGHKSKVTCNLATVLDKKQPEEDLWIGPDSNLRVVVQ